MRSVNVLVIDDSAFMRKMISEMLESDQRIHVVGTARNGEEALKKMAELQPDVLTLDIEMPVMDGLALLRQVMNDSPLPVVMLSSLTDKSADMTIQALEIGAVDFITKPSGGISLDIATVEEEIVSKVVLAAESKPAFIKRPVQKSSKNPVGKQMIVAIGTSTGGPKALQQVLPKLPANFPVPILVVQHMPKGFTGSLARRLDSLSAITVKEAEHGEHLKSGTAYIAQGGSQLKIKHSGKHLTCNIVNEETDNGHRPSVDVLYHSLADLENVKIIPVIMTGMGADGSKGLIYLKNKKPDTYTIAEAEQTAVIYGMPQAAKKTGFVDQVEDLQNIGAELAGYVNRKQQFSGWHS